MHLRNIAGLLAATMLLSICSGCGSSNDPSFAMKDEAMDTEVSVTETSRHTTRRYTTTTTTTTVTTFANTMLEESTTETTATSMVEGEDTNGSDETQLKSLEELMRMQSDEMMEHLGNYKMSLDDIGDMVYLENEAMYPQTRIYFRATTNLLHMNKAEDICAYMENDLRKYPQPVDKINTYEGGLGYCGLTCGIHYSDAKMVLTGLSPEVGDMGEYFCGAPASVKYVIPDVTTTLAYHCHFELASDEGEPIQFERFTIPQREVTGKNPTLKVISVRRAAQPRVMFTKVTASSTLRADGEQTYVPENLIDGNAGTCWSEAAAGTGIGEWVMFSADNPQAIRYLTIRGGYRSTEATYFRNGRPKRVEITFDDGSGIQFELEDNFYDYCSLCLTSADAIYTRTVKVTILDVYEGSQYNDTCISEIGFTLPS